MIVINPELNLGLIEEEYKDVGRVFVSDYLNPPLAEELYQCMSSGLPWGLFTTLRAEGYRYEELSGLSASERLELVPPPAHRYTAEGSGEGGFSRLSILKEVAAGRDLPPLLMELVRGINTPEYIAQMKQLTGLEKTVAVSGSLSNYEPGHYLASHTDYEPERVREAAHIISLTKDWNSSWGGRFTVSDNWGRVLVSSVPSFNTLALFKVPRSHYVSVVAAEASKPRYSFFGWLLNKNIF